MASQFDELAGDTPEERPKRGLSRSGSRFGSRQERVARSSQRSYSPRERTGPSRPAEVSERVWGLAEFWIQRGEVALGTRPAVNLPEFSKRLQAAIQADQDIRKAIERPEGQNPAEVGPEYVNDLISVMIENFWDTLAEGDKTHHQFKFLRDDWDDLYVAAETSLRVKRILKNPVVVTTSAVPKQDNPYLQKIAEDHMKHYLEAVQEPIEDVLPARKLNVRKPNKPSV